MRRTFVLILFVISFQAASLAAAALAQTTPEPKEKTSDSATTRKANQRPTGQMKSGAPEAEPFDAADVKKMLASCVTLETEAGAIELEMFPETAPETVRNFLNLAAIGFFDTTTFSRVVPGFVIQGGSLSTHQNPTPRLAARARRTIPDEPNLVKHERGIVSMARPDEPNMATTHFFILLTDAPSLDKNFAAFGRVTSGMETVEAINKMPVADEKPAKPVRINRATIKPCPVKTEQ